MTKLLQSMNNKQKQKVLVAMSGGVDSSVVAALLKKQGFDVTGIFLRLFDSPAFKKSEKNAKKIAKNLGMPFFVLGAQKKFKEKIIDYFLKEHKAGKTPNPCVLCNKEIKFKILLNEAKKRKFNFIATGHYVERSEIPTIGIRKTSEKISAFKMLKGRDKNKDQSYFLWQLSQNELKRILFPLGKYTKNQVCELAKKFGILKLVKGESQDICFIKGNLNEFLKKYIREKKGKIIDISENIVGEHKGIFFYTIGQRSGLGIGGANSPYYVIKKDFKKNTLIVSKNKKDLEKKELTIKKIAWVSGVNPKLPIKIKAKIRYHHESAIAIITKEHKVIFSKPQKAITAGQSIVFYKGKQLLGGGIIK